MKTMSERHSTTYLVPLCLLVLFSGAACSRSEPSPAAKPTEPAVSQVAPTQAPEAVAQKPPAWITAAKATALGLAAKVQAAGVLCNELTPAEHADFGADNKLSGEAVTASCTSEGDEDLTFYAFEDATKASHFIASKSELLCSSAIKIGVPDYPGVPYVTAGGNWIVEPDAFTTAEKLAPILGGEAKLAACPPPPPPPA